MSTRGRKDLPQTIEEFVEFKVQAEAQIERLKGLVESFREKHHQGDDSAEIESLTIRSGPCCSSRVANLSTRSRASQTVSS